MSDDRIEAECEYVDRVYAFKQRLRQRLRQASKQAANAERWATRVRNTGRVAVIETILRDAEKL